MVSRPPAPEPHGEITIEIDGGTESEPTPGRRRISNAALALAAVLVFLAAGVVVVFKWLPDRDLVAEGAVRSFLEAVREGDVDAALALIEDERGSNRFLTAEVLDDRWEIAQVVQVAYEDREVAWAEVYAEIEAHDGTRLGHRYRVRIEPGGPVLVNPLTYAGYEPGLHDIFDVNGYAVDPGEDTAVLLLPGLYSLYQSSPVTVESDLPSFLALGGQFIELGAEHPIQGFPEPRLRLSREGRRLLVQAIDSHLDSCAARPSRSGCPFAPPPQDERIDVPAGGDWDIVEYPQVEAMYTPAREGAEPFLSGEGTGLAFDLLTVEPGAVEVEAVVDETGNGERWATLECGIWMDGVYAVFGSGGEVTLVPGGEADDACRAMVEAG